ncbi:LPD29 domain-containing protein [Agarilytica rhodophyticola]|uniref:LPD29 domain-containing protein n=1 Tax=Agarilytica rhodophyticola TaxID=1737490 RepID=UPI000B348C01|nr:LPD29 domain-containing protein [Agarilytica rhodophyticola]
MARSPQAQVAAIIRKGLKTHGIKASVRSEGYAGGNSVTIDLVDQPPWVVKAIQRETSKYKRGSFNAMEDIYEHSNKRDDIPQVKFLFVQNRYSEEVKKDIDSQFYQLYEIESTASNAFLFNRFVEREYFKKPRVRA